MPFVIDDSSDASGHVIFPRLWLCFIDRSCLIARQASKSCRVNVEDEENSRHCIYPSSLSNTDGCDPVSDSSKNVGSQPIQTMSIVDACSLFPPGQCIISFNLGKSYNMLQWYLTYLRQSFPSTLGALLADSFAPLKQTNSIAPRMALIPWRCLAFVERSAGLWLTSS